MELIGEVETNSIDDVKNAFKIAKEAQKKWAKVPIMERARIVVQAMPYIADHFDDISNIITSEVGKTPNESFVTEVYGSIDSSFYFYNNVMDAIGKKEDIHLGLYNSFDKESYLVWKPIGVIGVIGPYNYPFIIPFEEIVQSLMAGNAVVFKPSSETVLTGKKIQEIFDHTDLPKGLLQTVYGGGSILGNIMIDLADKVIFTGSTGTGKQIMKRAADTLTPVSLELGGKSAMIVFPDADIDRAIKAARWGVFINSGQVCASVKRLYLHEQIYSEFVDKLTKMTKELKQDIPTKKNVDVGAMINEEQLKLVDDMVKVGIEEGAELLTGGRRNPNLKGYFYEPTLLGNCKNEMKVVQEEIFGPVLTIIPFKSEQEVIEMVNDNKYGLTSSVWTKDIEKGKNIAEEINTGSMMVNEVVYTFALAATPWGGTKYSGLGRTHGKLGFHDASRPLHVNVDQYPDPDPWWMPYDEVFENIVENFKVIAESLVIKEGYKG